MSDSSVIKNLALPPCNEIIGCLTTNLLTDANRQALTDNPREFILSQLNVGVADNIALDIVENGENTVHVALPYYESIDTAMSAQLSDEDLKNIAGGEIVVIASIIGGLIGAGVAVGAGVGGTAACFVPIAVGAGIGAAVGGAVAGGVVGGSVAASENK